jgi:hypothetical protein
MDYYLYNVDMPFSGIQLSYRELNSKDQLTLARINALLPFEDENFLEYSRILNKIISNCVENKEDIKKLNFIDFILFLTKLRIVSIGSEFNLSFKNDEDSTEKETKYSMDLNFFMKNLYDFSLKKISENIIDHKNIKIKLDYPNINSEKIFFTKNDNNDYDHILYTITEFIKEIHINGKKIEFSNFDLKQKNEIYQKLPITIKNIVEEKIINILKDFSDTNFFGIEKMNYFNFNFYNKKHQEFFRFILSGNLREIYQDYYVLASKQINPFYVDNLAISERKVFISFVKEEMKAMEDNNKSMDMPSNDENTTDLSNLMAEFGEV